MSRLPQVLEESGLGFDLLKATIASYANLTTLPSTDDDKM